MSHALIISGKDMGWQGQIARYRRLLCALWLRTTRQDVAEAARAGRLRGLHSDIDPGAGTARMEQGLLLRIEYRAWLQCRNRFCGTRV